MDFHHPIFYEYSPSRDWYWMCGECQLVLPNLNDLDEEHGGIHRRKYKRDLKEEIAKRQNDLKYLQGHLDTYGKYFKGKEKRRLLADAIIDNEENT